MCFSLSFLARGGRGRFPPSRLRPALRFMPMGCDLGGPRRRRRRRWGGERDGGGGREGMTAWIPSAPRAPRPPAPDSSVWRLLGCGTPPQTPRGASCSRGPHRPPLVGAPKPSSPAAFCDPLLYPWGGGSNGDPLRCSGPPCSAWQTMLALMGQHLWGGRDVICCVPPVCPCARAKRAHMCGSRVLCAVAHVLCRSGGAGGRTRVAHDVTHTHVSHGVNTTSPRFPLGGWFEGVS